MSAKEAAVALCPDGLAQREALGCYGAFCAPAANAPYLCGCAPKRSSGHERSQIFDFFSRRQNTIALRFKGLRISLSLGQKN